jgi:hypothetical protein
VLIEVDGWRILTDPTFQVLPIGAATDLSD